MYKPELEPFTVFGRLELEWCERKILFGRLELEEHEKEILFGCSAGDQLNTVIAKSLAKHGHIQLQTSFRPYLVPTP